jgi:hypothetical protein
MAQRRGVMDDDRVAGVQHRGQVGRAVQQRVGRRAGGQQHLLPHVPGAMSQPGRRGDDAVAAGGQRGQARRHLAGEPLHAADVLAHGGAGVDQDRRRVG